MRETMRGTAAMASGVKFTGCFRTAVFSIAPKICERRVVPDGLEWIDQNIAEQEFLFPEEEIAGIDRTIRQDAEFGAPGRTSHLRELGIVHAIGDEARTEDRTDMRGAEPLFYDGYELVKGNRRVKVLAVQGVAIDQIEFLWPEGEDVMDERTIH